MHAAVIVCRATLQKLAVGGVQVLLPEEVILLQATQLLLDTRGHICAYEYGVPVTVIVFVTFFKLYIYYKADYASLQQKSNSEL